MSILWIDGLKRHDIYIDSVYVGFVKIKKNDFRNMTEMEASIAATAGANLWLSNGGYSYHVEIYIFSIADETYAVWFSDTGVPRPNFEWPWWESGEHLIVFE